MEIESKEAIQSRVMATAATADGGDIMLEVGGLQNKAWAQDTSKFGYKMLMKMGWSAGKGLGKEMDGQVTHVRVKKRTENLGLGCDLKQLEVTGWSHTSKGFSDILAELNDAYGPATKKAKKKKKKKDRDAEGKKIKKKKKRDTAAPIVQRRILYHKRISNKNAKGYTETDMTAILGDAAKLPWGQQQ